MSRSLSTNPTFSFGIAAGGGGGDDGGDGGGGGGGFENWVMPETMKLKDYSRSDRYWNNIHDMKLNLAKILRNVLWLPEKLRNLELKYTHTYAVDYQRPVTQKKRYISFCLGVQWDTVWRFRNPWKSEWHVFLRVEQLRKQISNYRQFASSFFWY